MFCVNHGKVEAEGYCCSCGNMCCSDCLTIFEGEKYCARCFKPMGKKAGREFISIQGMKDKEKKHREALHSDKRQRLVVHTLEHEVGYGVSYAMNIKEPGFNLDLCYPNGEAMGKTRYFEFKDLKAVYYVKSFDGKYDRKIEVTEWNAQGSPIVIKFTDGEIVKGVTYAPYKSSASHFYVIPNDPASNNISMLVERHATEGIYSPEQWTEIQEREKNQYIAKHHPDRHSNSELEGDFYFKNHDYEKSLKLYKAAFEQEPENPKLKKKLIASIYNIGAGHIHRHEYGNALRCMNKILALQPDHEKAQRKSAKLHQILEKKARHRSRHAEHGAK